MFNVGEISANVTADQSKFNAAMGDVHKLGQRTANDIQKSFSQLGQRMKSIGTQMTAAITLPLIGAGTLAVKTAADYEKLRTSMNILNGSVEEGARNFERLKKFSAETPFQLQDLAKAQNMLQGFGLAADQSFESIKMIGDIAAVSGGSIEGIGIAFGQAAAEGKLMSRDIRQLINQGVPAIKLLANTMGVAESEIFDLASQGEISFKILNKAFQQATSEGGMFANGMAKQAKTISGVFSTLKDNVSLALGDVGQSLVDAFDIKGLIKDLTSQIQQGIKWFNALSDQTRKMAFTIAGLLGATGPVVFALGVLSTALGAISTPILAATAAVATGATLIIKNWDDVKKYFTTGGGAEMWDTLQSTIKSSFDSIKNIVSDASELLFKLWDEFGDSIVTTIQVSLKVIMKAFEVTFGRIETMMSKLNGTMNTELNVMEDNWLTTLDKISGKIDQFLLNQGKKLLQTFNVLDTEYDKLRKEFEKRGLEFDVGFIVTESDLEDMRNFLAKVEAMEGKAEFDVKLDNARMKEFNRMMDEIRERDVIIEPKIDLSFVEMGDKMFRRKDFSLPFTVPSDELAVSMEETLNNISKIIGSEVPVMSQKMIVPISQGLQVANMLADQFTSSFGQGMANVVVQGERLVDTLKNIGKLLLSSAIQTGISLLLTGGLSGGGFFGSGGGLFGRLFGGGKAKGGPVSSGMSYVVGEQGPELFTPSRSGSILPNSGSVGGGGGMSAKEIKSAFKSALRETVTEVSPSRVFELSQKGRADY